MPAGSYFGVFLAPVVLYVCACGIPCLAVIWLGRRWLGARTPYVSTVVFLLLVIVTLAPGHATIAEQQLPASWLAFYYGPPLLICGLVGWAAGRMVARGVTRPRG